MLANFRWLMVGMVLLVFAFYGMRRAYRKYREDYDKHVHNSKESKKAYALFLLEFVTFDVSIPGLSYWALIGFIFGLVITVASLLALVFPSNIK